MKILNSNIWNNTASKSTNRRNSKQIKINTKEVIEKKIIKKIHHPSPMEIRAKLEKKFGKSDLNGEYRIANNKAIKLAKKAKTNSFQLRSAMRNGTVNFSDKEKEVLAKILGN